MSATMRNNGLVGDTVVNMESVNVYQVDASVFDNKIAKEIEDIQISAKLSEEKAHFYRAFEMDDRAQPVLGKSLCLDPLMDEKVRAELEHNHQLWERLNEQRSRPHHEPSPVATLMSLFNMATNSIEQEYKQKRKTTHINQFIDATNKAKEKQQLLQISLKVAKVYQDAYDEKLGILINASNEEKINAMIQDPDLAEAAKLAYSASKKVVEVADALQKDILNNELDTVCHYSIRKDIQHLYQDEETESTLSKSAYFVEDLAPEIDKKYVGNRLAIGPESEAQNQKAIEEFQKIISSFISNLADLVKRTNTQEDSSSIQATAHTQPRMDSQI